MVPTCPVCGADGVPVMFGLPVPEARAAAAAGDLVLAGCIVYDDRPGWRCQQGHDWHDPNRRLWDDRLLEVLVAHGYVDDVDVDDVDEP